MNTSLFKSLLKPYWESNSIKDLDDAADKIATAYDLSNVGDTQTIFGSKLIKGNKDILKTCLSIGMQVNFASKYVTKENEVPPGFTIMATGFCLYWLRSTFTPLPTMPPMIAPTTGVTVLFPGYPGTTKVSLDYLLKNAFDNTEIDNVLDALSTALVTHLLSVAGIYSGTIIVGTVPSPMILPWTVLIGSSN
jgi:hypothetical protein